MIEDGLLEQVARVLKITPQAIKSFDEETVFNYFNTFNDNSTGAFQNYHCTFNPIENIVELYDALVKTEREKNELLQRMPEEKNR